LALSLFIGPELIYIDVTPVAGKGKNMLFLEQHFFKHSAIYWTSRHNMLFFEKQRHLLDVNA
jgi:hypothetical protein